MHKYYICISAPCRILNGKWVRKPICECFGMAAIHLNMSNKALTIKQCLFVYFHHQKYSIKCSASRWIFECQYVEYWLIKILLICKSGDSSSAITIETCHWHYIKRSAPFIVSCIQWEEFKSNGCTSFEENKKKVFFSLLETNAS